MKKILFISLVAVMFAACSAAPEDVAGKFAESIAKGDIDEAKKYTTLQTGALLDMAKGLKADKLPTFPDYKFEVLKDSIVKDTAWVTYKTPLGDEGLINLIKEEGEWKVTVGK